MEPVSTTGDSGRKLAELFDFFWKSHSSITPDALKIHTLLEERGERIVNDHVAFRTFDLDPIGVESLGETFLKLGYEQSGEYRFEAKKLRAISYAHPEPDQPHVFISELLTGEFSSELQAIVKRIVGTIPGALKGSSRLLQELPTWPAVSYAEYRALLAESEYAGWLAAYGIRVNHFTVSVNALETFGSLQELNAWLIESGFRLNESGGLVKGSPEVLLEQSSTMANEVDWEFAGGERARIPSCYYEFARRYTDPDTGALYRGFVARSADRIFESTNTK
jgi:hypothetical protein